MQKDELIQLHTLLLQIKTYLEQIYGNDGCAFSEYEKLNITPYQIYKSKREHKLAIFTLGKEIAAFLASDEYSSFGKVSSRLGQMAERFKTNRQKEQAKINKN
ncbi:MAG: metal-binding protein [Thermoplasmata archaeon]|nr:MAG: metal-binding protein [Thermoplasmata archaeon]